MFDNDKRMRKGAYQWVLSKVVGVLSRRLYDVKDVCILHNNTFGAGPLIYI